MIPGAINVKLGSESASRVYLGSQVVWSSVPTPSGIMEVELVSSSFTGTRPQITFTETLQENDFVVLFSSTGTNAEIYTSYDFSEWSIVGGVLIKPANSAVTVGCQIHRVTSADVSGSTVTFGNQFYQASEVGGVHGVLLRGVDSVAPVNTYSSSFGATQPFGVAGILGSALSTGSYVLSLMGVDLAPTLGAPTNGWVLRAATPGTGHSGGLYGRPATATAGVDIPAGTVVPSPATNDDWASLSVAFEEG